MKISRIAAPITVLGPGRRVGIWVQGCTLACPGCASIDTWAASGGREMSTDEVVAEVLRLVEAYALDGITISGGEPFQQAEQVADVLTAVRAVRPDLDVVAFTGYDAAVARRRSVRLTRLIDILVAGRYDRTQPSDRPLVASANQKVVTTDRGALAYDRAFGPLVSHEHTCAHARGTSVQIAADGDDLFIVGLPQSGDLDRLHVALAERGISLAGASWQ